MHKGETPCEFQFEANPEKEVSRLVLCPSSHLLISETCEVQAFLNRKNVKVLAHGIFMQLDPPQTLHCQLHVVYHVLAGDVLLHERFQHDVDAETMSCR